MATLANLPNELVDVIAGHIRQNEAPAKDFCALSLTCHKLHGAIEPSLYQNFDCVFDGGEAVAPSVFLLLRTFMMRPTLSSYVQNIYMRGWQGSTLGKSTIARTYHPEEFKKLNAVIYGLSQDLQTESWGQGAESNKAELLVATLVSMCHNIRSIDLDFNSEADESLVDLVLANFLFPHLTMVKYRAEDVKKEENEHRRPESGMHVHHLSHLLSIPSIATINAHHLSLQALIQIPPTMTLNWSLASLVLTRVECHESEIEKLLLMTTNLRELVWDRWLDCEYRAAVYNCDDVMQALKPVQNTLESLTLGVHFYISTKIDVGNPGPQFLDGRLGSLDGFKKLTRLEAPFAVLMGWRGDDLPLLTEHLPHHLTHLTLTDGTYDIFDNQRRVRAPLENLKLYLQDASTSAPDLQMIELKLQYTDWGLAAEYMHLDTLCADRGILWKLEYLHAWADEFEPWEMIRCEEWDDIGSE